MDTVPEICYAPNVGVNHHYSLLPSIYYLAVAPIKVNVILTVYLITPEMPNLTSISVTQPLT
jgi:hypothetical protein